MCWIKFPSQAHCGSFFVAVNQCGASGLAKVLVEGLRRAGRGLTRTRFLQTLESLRRFELGGYEVNYGKGARQGRVVDLTIIGKGEKFTR